MFHNTTRIIGSPTRVSLPDSGLCCYAQRNSVPQTNGPYEERVTMIYLVYKMHLTEKSRRDMKAFWHWMADREKWFYSSLPMVKSVRWYYSVIGDVYTIESWSGFEDEAGFGEYRKVLSVLKKDDEWETERVSQDDYWEFLSTRLVTDPPVEIGFGEK
jgi:hypothetical protein